jgi:hypothetical protein
LDELLDEVEGRFCRERTLPLRDELPRDDELVREDGLVREELPEGLEREVLEPVIKSCIVA